MADASDGPHGTPDGVSSSHTGGVVTVATTNNLHQPGFLRIPPELRLEIYELSMPRMTTILVHAGKSPPEAFHNDKPVLPSSRFLPRLPAISQVCRRTRSEYPFYDYYTSNTFLFMENMLHSSILDRFLACRGETVKAMSHIKVNFISLTFPYEGHNLRIRLSMTRPKTGIVSVENLFVSSPYESRPVDICLCGGLGWAIESTQSDSSILERLRIFVAYCEAFSALTRNKSNIEESTCEQCRKVKFVSAPEPPPISDEIRQNMKGIAAKAAATEKLAELQWLKELADLGGKGG
ncbi:hypothetical protein LTR56_020243 [Elasticomyces elasticus]|nr:hypothetical protein LTR56_020243 [Elasticomyces elasticus]KAK3633454.1 hypothetical protein LTR22_020130 [Elasticomyces elasticus]KAK4907436.1 hypothetical protein LTR49_023539 [Elasticomyces elasticus]KAK5747844.1 hypothetical protein LTS12_022101 [Elasticomyces elasticus]